MFCGKTSSPDIQADATHPDTAADEVRTLTATALTDGSVVSDEPNLIEHLWDPLEPDS